MNNKLQRGVLKFATVSFTELLHNSHEGFFLRKVRRAIKNSSKSPKLAQYLKNYNTNTFRPMQDIMQVLNF